MKDKVHLLFPEIDILMMGAIACIVIAVALGVI
jgi:hypothetical protein